MGRGGEAAAGGHFLRRTPSFSLSDLQDDLKTLKHLWFSTLGSKPSGDHAARLESFYGPQAAACRLHVAAIAQGVHVHGLTPTLLQTTSSAPASCGAGGPCWQRAQLACASAAT
jgi:hypothetical protein